MAAKKTGPMCVVTIGYQKVLLPAAAGMKVVALLSEALEVEWDHDRDRLDSYIVGDPLEVSFKTARPGSVRLRPNVESSRAMRLLEGK